MGKLLGTFTNAITRILNYASGMLRDADGTPSASRFWMSVFSIVTIVLLTKIIKHLFGITDANMTGVWLTNMPLFIGAMVTLISAPYLINKGSASFSDLAGALSSLKGNGNGATVDGAKTIINEVKNTIQTGTDGEKG
jgi:hypothetical protein